MKTENTVINNLSYTLHIQYQNDEKLRMEFNRMTRQFWEFDFENYYQSGFWDSTCILYSLFDGERIISHTTGSLFTHTLDGQTKTLLQLGTVMTDEEYRNQGLSRFLMERIQTDFKEKADGMFLFANESVMDFYPKFGFVPVQEYEALQKTAHLDFTKKQEARKLNLDHIADLKLFENLVENAFPNTSFPTKSKGLTFFYCYANPEMGYKDAVYFIEKLNCAVVMEIDEKILHIIDIFSPVPTDLNEVIAAFSDISFTEVVLGFSPDHGNFEYRLWKDEDLQLFVSQELQESFEKYQLKIPALSHT